MTATWYLREPVVPSSKRGYRSIKKLTLFGVPKAIHIGTIDESLGGPTFIIKDKVSTEGSMIPDAYMRHLGEAHL